MGPTQWDAATDPRPDIESDHHLWGRLLPAAFQLCGLDVKPGSANLAWSLQGLRCCGAKLERSADGTVRLIPGEIDERDWKGWRTRWLKPYAAQLTALLRDLAADLRKLEEVA